MVLHAAVFAVENRPFPQHVIQTAGSIRPNNYSQTALDTDVRLFYNKWKADYVKSAGTVSGVTRYRVSFGSTNPGRTVSEGQGYGMVIVALMAGHDPAAKAVFDGMLAFALANPSVIDHRLMGWEIPNSGGADSAFDGDADIAYGLMLAQAQWGGTSYAASANSRLAGILASTIGPQSHLPTLGDWVSYNDTKFNQYTPRSSDFMPGHFRAYARFTGNSVWNTVADNCNIVSTAIQSNYSKATGLLPGFIVGANPLGSAKPATGTFLEASSDGYYDYNAGRDPWRIGVDALLNGNATSMTLAKKMASWAKAKSGGNALNIKGPYKLDGSQTSSSNGFTTFFAAPFGVASMLDAANQTFLNSIYANVRVTHEDYFEDSVTLLSMLAMTGNFWDPTLALGADVSAPTVPTALLATAQSSSSIRLTWNASTDNKGVTGYDVYRGATKIATATTNSHLDTGLAASTAYTYKVQARDAAANLSAFSAVASANTMAITTPPTTGTIYQAEQAVLFGAKVVSSYVDYINASGDYIEWTVSSPVAGPATLGFRYALSNGDRPLEIKLNNVVVNARLSFPSTGSSSTYQTVSLAVNLPAGSSKVKATAIGASGANMDYLMVTLAPTPEP